MQHTPTKVCCPRRNRQPLELLYQGRVVATATRTRLTAAEAEAEQEAQLAFVHGALEGGAPGGGEPEPDCHADSDAGAGAGAGAGRAELPADASWLQRQVAARLEQLNEKVASTHPSNAP